MNWKTSALVHAKDQDPKEAVGLVLKIKGKERYFPKTLLLLTINLPSLSLLVSHNDKFCEFWLFSRCSDNVKASIAAIGSCFVRKQLFHITFKSEPHD